MTKQKRIRIGVLGLTHDHIWDNLQELRAVKDAVLVAAADPNQPLLDKVKKSFRCATYSDFQTMLDMEELDAVYIYSDNATGVELAELAAAKNLHLMVEKPMAATLAGADQMLAAARWRKVRLMINWPFAWWPQLQKAMAMARGGELGDVWQVKYRAAHAGPREMGCSTYFCDWLYNPKLNGAGAYMDYCCYGAVLARALLGVPARVNGFTGRLCKHEMVGEDNGVLMMTYPRALAISEASWTQIGHLSSYVTMIYGTKATLMVEPRAGAKLLLADAEHPDGIEVKVPKAPRHLTSASAHFVHCLLTGEEFFPLCHDVNCRDAQEILEAGLISAETGTEVSLPLRNLGVSAA